MHSVRLHGLPAMKGMFSGGKPLENPPPARQSRTIRLNIKGLRPLHASLVEVLGFVDGLRQTFRIREIQIFTKTRKGEDIPLAASLRIIHPLTAAMPCRFGDALPVIIILVEI